MRNRLLALLLMLCTATTAAAAEPYFAFEPEGKSGPIAAKEYGWHTQYEKVGDYGETWFFMAQTDSGALLVAMLSITNLGLHTFDSCLDVQYYPPGGKTIRLHREFARDAIGGSDTSMELRVGPTHVWGNAKSQHITISEEAFELKLDFTNTLPSLQFGDGAVYLYKDKSALFATGIFAPRAKSSGTLKVPGQTFDLSGNGFGEHGYSTIKIPTMMRKWFNLRAYDATHTLILQDQYMAAKFGGRHNQYGVFAVDGRSYPLRSFTYAPTAFEKDAKTGYSLPIAFEVSFTAGPYTVKGTVKKSRLLDAIDVLGQLNALVRAFIKAFYSNPFVFRFWDQFELDVSGPDGRVEHLSGQGVVEANMY